MKPAPPVTHTARDAIAEPLSWREIRRLAPLGEGFYQRDTQTVAVELLGKLLVRALPEGPAAVRLTEVEAYLGVADPAAHTFGGRRTARNQVMWGEAAHLYVYFTYGMHHCANVVTRSPGVPEAVLMRGGVPVLGLALLRTRRPGIDTGHLTDGPAKLCQALAIDRALDGADLTRRRAVWLADDGWRCPAGAVVRSPRVGVGYAGEAASWPLRFRISPG
jgi:DNA-3-methyladenine glycosylase